MRRVLPVPSFLLLTSLPPTFLTFDRLYSASRLSSDHLFSVSRLRLERVNQPSCLDHPSLRPHRRRQFHARPVVWGARILVCCHQDRSDCRFDVSIYIGFPPQDISKADFFWVTFLPPSILGIVLDCGGGPVGGYIGFRCEWKSSRFVFEGAER